MRIPPSFIFWCVVRFPYVVRSSRAANTSAARRGDAHHDCADNGPETRTTPPHPPSWRGVVRRVKLATLIMSQEIRQVLSENCCMWYGNRVENWLNSGRLTGKNDFFDGKLDRSMPP
jgi:hypothetical protein